MSVGPINKTDEYAIRYAILQATEGYAIAGTRAFDRIAAEHAALLAEVASLTRELEEAYDDIKALKRNRCQCD